MRTALVRLVIAFIALGLIAGVYLSWAWNHRLELGSDTYLVKPGMTWHGLARELRNRGVLLERHSLVWLAYLSRHHRDLKTGEYRFRNGITAKELLDQVVAGRVIEYPVVLVEGWTFNQFMQALEQSPKLTHSFTGLPPKAVMEKLGLAGEHPEGRFFPDTYYYSAGQSDRMILANAYDKMQKLLDQEWQNRDADLPFKNSYEALIMASIVEKETGRADERPMIAGAFINRLRRGMRLQSDPTTIYGMGAAFDGNLRLKDLRRATPYNTYTRSGLPPSPIAMPGKESIRAVLHPAKTRAVFFVARGDGSHEFSETLSEHNRAVIKYQLKGKARDFSSHTVKTPYAPRPSSPSNPSQ
ncbi:MAG: endolytic transglycosylase MltG [Gammaproteobacteria bacterium]|nr:endolytic transglycosylase MltG [Gammaproteobacteria bacterium]